MARIYAVLLMFATAVLCSTAYASCGSTFCTINTGETALGPWVKPGWRFDLHAEYIDQDTLRSGTKKVDPSGEPDEHDEIRTINRNLVALVDYSWTETWGVSVLLPWVNRYHKHIFNDPIEGPEPEKWDFSELGDMRVVGRYQFPNQPDSDHFVGLRFGLKLPTGSTDVTNSEGELAERSLQPGTGTTDVVLGAYYSTPFGPDRTSWFVEAGVVAPLDSHDNFKPGIHTTFNVGLNYAFAEKVSASLQLNLSHKGRDSGAEAEPQDSGSDQAFISPGLSVEIGRTARLYGFVQFPIYQDVNGTQLTADRAYALGWAQVF